MLMAFIIPTPANTVKGTAQYQEKFSIPHMPWKESIDLPVESIIVRTTRISSTNLDVGVSPKMSSIAPAYNMTTMDNTTGSRQENIPDSNSKSAKRESSPHMETPTSTPMTTPKKTANPPTTGTGAFCNFRASGLSTRCLSLAIFKTLKNTHLTDNSETSITKANIIIKDMLITLFALNFKH